MRGKAEQSREDWRDRVVCLVQRHLLRHQLDFSLFPFEKKRSGTWRSSRTGWQLSFGHDCRYKVRLNPKILSGNDSERIIPFVQLLPLFVFSTKRPIMATQNVIMLYTFNASSAKPHLAYTLPAQEINDKIKMRQQNRQHFPLRWIFSKAFKVRTFVSPHWINTGRGCLPLFVTLWQWVVSPLQAKQESR